MWTAYSTRDAAEFVGLSESAVRSCVRAGLLNQDQSRLRFSFRDLLVLKMVKGLVGDGMSLRRARRELAALRARVPREATLSSVSVGVADGHVVVREGSCAYRADNGQLFLDLDLSPSGLADVSPMPMRQEAAGPEPVAERTADDWFELAIAQEEDDPTAAVGSYRRVLELRGNCAETQINLGRLYAELGKTDDAEVCFRAALDNNPNDPTAVYNLGVVAQDRGADGDAVQLYRQALELDPQFAEAHYNLATIFDRTGEAQAAIRHINEYRKLTR